MFDIKKAKEEAELELAREQEEKAKLKIKSKLRERDQARKLLANIERELEDLYSELSQDP